MSLQYINAQQSGEHDDAVWKLCWTARNEVLSASADGGLRVWSPSSPKTPTTHLRAHTLGITSLSVDGAGARVLSVSVDGAVRLSELGGDGAGGAARVVGRKETYAEEISLGAGEKVSVLSAWAGALHPEGTSYATTGQGARVAFYRVGEAEGDAEGEAAAGLLAGECEKMVETGRGKFGMDLCYSPDGRTLALSAESGHITILDVATQTVVANHASHGLAARSISWSPDSQWLFSASDDRRIVLHDVRAGSGGSGRASAAVAELFGHTSWVLSVKASPDGRLLASGGADSAVKLWDVGQRACVMSTGTAHQVWSVDWQPLAANQASVGKAFVSGGDDARVSWWKAAGSA